MTLHEHEKSAVFKDLRSILCSSPHGVEITELNKEYRELNGQNIPFRKFNYTNLMEFLRDGPTYCRMQTSHNGAVMVRAVQNSGTAHVAEMVNKQKRKKTTRRLTPRLAVYSHLNHTGPWAQAGRPRIGFSHVSKLTNSCSRPSWPLMHHNRNGKIGVGHRLPQSSTNLASRFSHKGPSVSATKMPLTVSDYFHDDHTTAQATVAEAPAAKSFQEILTRVCSVIGNREKGVLSTRIEFEYKVKFKDLLPRGWERKLESLQEKSLAETRILFEPLPNGIFLVKRWVDPPAEPEGDTSDSSSISSIHVPENYSPEAAGDAWPDPKENCVEHIQMKRDGIPTQLILPEGNNWSVLVTGICSSSKVYVRLFGEEYQNAFLVMTEQMNEYYSQNVASQVLCEKENVYAAFYEGEWNRVFFVESKGDQALCYFIDCGGPDELISVTDLRELRPEFCKLAPQAALVTLAGLPESNSPEVVENVHKHLFGKAFIGVVVSRNDDAADYSVVLYDTFSDEDINMNEVISSKIGSKNAKKNDLLSMSLSSLNLSEDATPNVSQNTTGIKTFPTTIKWNPVEEINFMKGMRFDAVVTFIVDPSTFYVRLLSFSERYRELSQAMSSFYSNSKNRVQFREEHIKTDPHVGVNLGSNTWCRGRVEVDCSSGSQTKMFTIKLIDTGDSIRLPIEKLQPLWPNFRKDLIMAMECELAEVLPRNGRHWSDVEMKWFSELRNKSFSCRITERRRGAKYTIIMLDDQRANVGYKLMIVGSRV